MPDPSPPWSTVASPTGSGIAVSALEIYWIPTPANNWRSGQTTRSKTPRLQTLLDRFEKIGMKHAPPVLYSSGHRPLLDGGGGLVIVGSRDAGDTDLGFTRQLAEQTALAGKSVISGGARGVDETAMLAEKGGQWLDETLVHQGIETLWGGKPSPASPEPTPVPAVQAEQDLGRFLADHSLYEIFRLKLEKLLASEAYPPEELENRLDIARTQLNTWLKQGVEEGWLIKDKGKSVRYRLDWQQKLLA